MLTISFSISSLKSELNQGLSLTLIVLVLVGIITFANSKNLFVKIIQASSISLQFLNNSFQLQASTSALYESKSVSL